MAKGRSSATTPTLTSWSPSHTTDHNSIHHRYVQIPSDQKKLLDGRDAWSAGGLRNIPSAVLEDLRARHAKQSGPHSRVERETRSLQAASSLQAESETLSSQPASPVPRDTMPDTPKIMPAEEEIPARPVSWSPSPSAHLRRPSRPGVLGAAACPSRRCSPEELTARPAAVKAASRADFFEGFPVSSSLGSEPGLEFEIPKAITDVVEPVNRKVAAILGPTPPSAQVIPSTLADQIPSVEQVAKAKRRGRMKPLNLDSPDRVVQRHASSRLAPPRTVSSRLPRSSSPVLTSSPPIPKAALRPRGSSSSASPSTGEGQRSAVATHPDIVLATSQLVSNQASRNELPPNVPLPQDPFTAFKRAYPDYEVSINDFIRGLIVVFSLQKRKALPAFVYDDFIRVFSTDYLDYIVESSSDDRTQISARQWYCANVSQPLYTQRIVTKNNIESILNQYPARVRAIERALGTSEPRRHSLAARPEPGKIQRHTDVAQQTPVTAGATNVTGLADHNGEPFVGAIPTTEGPRRVEEAQGAIVRPRSNLSVARTGSARRPNIGTTDLAHIGSDTKYTAEPVQNEADFSLLDIEQTQTSQVDRMRRPVANTRSNAMFSQLSNPDSIPETAVKRRRGPWASNGLSAGEPGAAFKRSQNPTTNKETRDRRFRKFLLRRATQSSAPGGSAAS